MGAIPVIAVPEEFNRILILLHEHSGQPGLDPETLVDLAAASTLHANIPAHSSTIAAALGLGFIRKQGGKVRLDSLGMRFLQLNPECTYELATSQSTFLVERCVFEGAYRDHTRALLKQAYLDRQAKRVWIDLGNVLLSPDERKLLSFLRRIGFVVVRENLAEVAASYLTLAMALIKKRLISMADLELLLAERAQRGSEAERWVLGHERKRLRRAGLPLEASAVAIVSEADVCAGYDIESFDGESTGLAPNRFIEVKSTTTDELVFFWSKNEIDVARSLGDCYWIYHLRCFGAGTDCELTVFQSPLRLVKSGRLLLEPYSYRVVCKSK